MVRNVISTRYFELPPIQAEQIISGMEVTFNQWEFFPINLNTYEIANPLNVISDFFSDDSLNGYLDRLTQWRDFVLRDDYFRDHKESPAV